MTAQTPPPIETDDVDPPGRPNRAGASWGQVLAVALVMAFFGGAVGYVVGVGRAPSTDSVDVGFYRDMTVHHDQAIQMAVIELSHGENSIVRSFAKEILIFQRWEMGRMYERLRGWGITTEPPTTSMAWMGMPVETAAMPGLATSDQMRALQGARGAAADAMFLELMAAHHIGGIHMAEYAAKRADHADVRALAEVMVRNQASDIGEFRQVAERFGLAATIPPYPAQG